MIPLQLVTRWNVYGVAPNRGYIQVNKNEGIHEDYTNKSISAEYAGV
jgi:hypothetical protein